MANTAFNHDPALTVAASNTTAGAAVKWVASKNLGESLIILDSGGNGRIGLAGDVDLITLTSGTVTVAGTVSATLVGGAAVKDEDNMASDSATHLASQQSIKAYVDAAGGIASVVADTSPQLGGNLDMQASLLVGNGGSTGIAISANGEVTMAAQPSFLAFNSADTSNVTGTNTEVTVEFDSEVFDQNDDYNNSNYTFTAPVTGRYLFVGAVTAGGMSHDTASTGFVKIAASNRSARHTFDAGNDANAAGGGAFASIIDMDASDTCVIKFAINGESGDTVDIKGDSTLMQTYFSGLLVA